MYHMQGQDFFSPLKHYWLCHFWTLCFLDCCDTALWFSSDLSLLCLTIFLESSSFSANSLQVDESWISSRAHDSVFPWALLVWLYHFWRFQYHLYANDSQIWAWVPGYSPDFLWAPLSKQLRCNKPEGNSLFSPHEWVPLFLIHWPVSLFTQWPRRENWESFLSLSSVKVTHSQAFVFYFFSYLLHFFPAFLP